jgi:hypothetical protein
MFCLTRAAMMQSVALRSAGVADVTAPTLSSPADVAASTTTGTGTVSTNESGGTLYAVVTTSVTPPSVAQVKAGQNNGGTAAAYATNQAVVSSGVQNVSFTGLTQNTQYYAYYVHTDAAANNSTVSAANGFVTFYADAYQAAVDKTSAASSFTWTAFPIGTARADRVFTFYILHQASAAQDISSVTVNGSAVGLVNHASVPSGTSTNKLHSYSIIIAAGTTADIVATFSGTISRAVLWGYAHTRGTSPTVVSDTTATSGVVDGTITVVTNGLLIAGVMAASASPPTFQFAYDGQNFSIEDHDRFVAGTLYIAGGRHAVAGTAQTVSATCTDNTANPMRMTALAFGVNA